MAQSQNNLNIQIGIDTKKLRADRAIAQEELRKLNEEMKKATRAGDVQQVQNIAARQDTLARSIAGATREINAQTRATEGNTAATVRNAEAHAAFGRASAESSKAIREQSRLIKDFGEAFGVPIRGLGVMKSGLLAFGATEVLRAIKSGADALNELNNAAAGFRIRPEALRQAREGVQKIGQDAQTADQILSNLSKNWDEAILKQRERGGVAGVTVFQGGRGVGPGVAIPAEGGGGRLLATGGMNLTQLQGLIARGGQPPGIGDLNKMIEGAGGIFPFALGRQPDLKKQDQEWQELARTILRVKDATVQNALALKAYGQTFETAFGTEQRPGLERQRAMGTLPRPRIITPEEQTALDQFNDSLTTLKTTLEDITHMPEALTGVSTLFKDMNETIKTTVREAQALGRALEYILSLPGKVASAVGTTLSGSFAGDPSGIPAMPRASGGMIRGPGTGTSDSIPAWLSNGEYVINAASVRRLGTGFLHSLNSFALGGMVGAPSMNFAAGGLAGSSGGGRPVHLHLGGQAFALSGSNNVVESLISHSHAQQMRSAGVKPSWFAGRPGGR